MGVIKTMASPKSAKAFVAAIMAAISSAIVAAPDGFTTVELLTIFGALVATFQATYWTTNAKTYDGTIDIEEVDNKKIYSLNLDSDPNDIDSKRDVIFKINA